MIFPTCAQWVAFGLEYIWNDTKIKIFRLKLTEKLGVII